MALPNTLDRILDPHYFADLTGVSFRGLSITESVHGYNVVVRGRARDGKGCYAISFSTEYVAGLHDLVHHLGTKNGDALWRHDKYYSEGGGS